MKPNDLRGGGVVFLCVFLYLFSYVFFFLVSCDGFFVV